MKINIFGFEIPKDIESKCGISYVCEWVGYDNGGRCNMCAKNIDWERKDYWNNGQKQINDTERSL